jgi:hypothetical protein
MVYLVGGVDDVLNYVRTQGTAGGFFDWFLGAQLVFNDEDLKSLLCSAAAASHLRRPSSLSLTRGWLTL